MAATQFHYAGLSALSFHASKGNSAPTAISGSCAERYLPDLDWARFVFDSVAGMEHPRRSDLVSLAENRQTYSSSGISFEASADDRPGARDARSFRPLGSENPAENCRVAAHCSTGRRRESCA